jgi:Na+/H+-translocating membrane pyrophosphatase
MENLIYVVPAMGIVGLLYTFIKFNWVSKQDPGTERMKEISNYIAVGAMAFLKAECSFYWNESSYQGKYLTICCKNQPE